MFKKIDELLRGKSTMHQKEFANSLIPNSLPMIGVRTPDVRMIAKIIIKDDFKKFLDECKPDTFEMQLLKGFVIASAPMTIEDRLHYLDLFIPTITDWAVHDGLVSSLKCTYKYMEEMLNYILKYKDSRKEFEVRFVAVMLMNYYLNDEHIELVFSVLNELFLADYYSKMGVAWCVATAMAKYPERTIKFLESNNLDHWTINKAISKARESFRVTKNDKDYILRFKK